MPSLSIIQPFCINMDGSNQKMIFLILSNPNIRGSLKQLPKSRSTVIGNLDQTRKKISTQTTKYASVYKYCEPTTLEPLHISNTVAAHPIFVSI